MFSPELLKFNQSLIDHQKELETTHNNNLLTKKLKEVFDEYPEELLQDIPKSFATALLSQMYLRKRADAPTLLGVLQHYANSLEEAIAYLEKSAEIDLVDYDTSSNVFVMKYTLEKEVEEQLNAFQFPIPLVVSPRHLKKNNQSAYYMKQKDSVILNGHTKEDICLDHINRMNQIPLTLNQDVLNVVKNSWKGVAKKEEGESEKDFKAKVKAFEKFNENAHKLIDLMADEGNEFYLSYKYDNRGRTYSQGYYINIQSNDWGKSFIELARKEYLKD